MLAEQVEMTQIDFQSEGHNVSGRSLVSPKHPERNEDSMLWVPESRLGIVADGSSDSEDGSLASRTVMYYLAEHLDKTGRKVNDTKAEIARHLLGASIHLEQMHPGYFENKSTAAVVKLIETPDGEVAVFGNVGDSRGCLHRSGSLKQVTYDHSLFNSSNISEIRKRRVAKAIDEFESDEAAELLEEKEPYIFDAFYTRNWVVQILGHSGRILPDPEFGFSLPVRLRAADEINPFVKHIRLKQNDLLVLATDGIHDVLRKSVMNGVLKDNPRGNFASSLIQAAVDQETEGRKNVRNTFDDKTVLTIQKIA